MVYKAILVDDEQSALNILSKFLKKYCHQIEVVDTCKDVEEAVASIKKHSPSLVFLDIEMPNYAGYEILSFFEKVNFEIIFVTAYNQYAIKAFEVSAIDYLLKPVAIDRLKTAVDRFCMKESLKGSSKSYEVLKESLKEKTIDKIVIPYQGDRKIIIIDDIIAMEANESYTNLYDTSGNRFVVSKNLKQFEAMLADNDSFFRSHKSWLINTARIDSYSKTNLEINLSNGIKAKLSKYRKSEFQEKYNL